MANFKELSRYTGGVATKNREGKNFLILRQPLNLQPEDGDIFVTITQELAQRPDLVAAKAYGIPDLWWVIYEFNGVRDPLFDLQINQVIRLPELERVIQAVTNLQT